VAGFFTNWIKTTTVFALYLLELAVRYLCVKIQTKKLRVFCLSGHMASTQHF